MQRSAAQRSAAQRSAAQRSAAQPSIRRQMGARSPSIGSSPPAPVIPVNWYPSWDQEPPCTGVSDGARRAKGRPRRRAQQVCPRRRRGPWDVARTGWGGSRAAGGSGNPAGGSGDFGTLGARWRHRMAGKHAGSGRQQRQAHCQGSELIVVNPARCSAPACRVNSAAWSVALR
jgi:hypothetical protein